jgi:hypothetical protein
MSLNQKRSDFTRVDLFALAAAAAADIKKPKAEKIIAQIISVFKNCENIFREAGVFDNHIQEIKRNLRIDIKKSTVLISSLFKLKQITRVFRAKSKLLLI